MAKVGVWDISDKDPSNLEDPLPFVRCPHGAASRVVNLNGKVIMGKSRGVVAYDTHRCQHLRHPAEVTTMGIIQSRKEETRYVQELTSR